MNPDAIMERMDLSDTPSPPVAPQESAGPARGFSIEGAELRNYEVARKGDDGRWEQLSRHRPNHWGFQEAEREAVVAHEREVASGKLRDVRIRPIISIDPATLTEHG